MSMDRVARLNQIRTLAKNDAEAIEMILCACADKANESGLLLSAAQFNETAQMILAYLQRPRMTARPRPTADDIDGMAGCVRQWVNRAGVPVAVFDREATDLDGDGKWLAFCEKHGSMLCTDTQAQAFNAARHTTSFCDECRAEQPTTSQE